MVRRRSPSHLVPLPDPLPDGWRAHDGGPSPVQPDAMPAVWFRGGQRMQADQRTAASWEGWKGRATGSCWIWEDDAFDIVAFMPER